MSLLPLIGFLLLALLAIAFAVVPLLRRGGRGRALLAGAIALALLGVGAGTYLLVGRPALAVRDSRKLADDERDPRALIKPLVERVRKYPNDQRAWVYLAQAYMAAKDPANAAKALAKVIGLVGRGNPELDADYGEALVMANGGQVPDEAEAAFRDALKLDPRNVPARFYMGLARLGHNDRVGAIGFWQSLLNDVPPTAPLHQMLVDRLAVLNSQTGGMPAGGPRAMVAQLAARLKADPQDAVGWVRLMRAYVVLGETDKAKEALATARKTFATNKDAQTAFSTAAKALKLE